MSKRIRAITSENKIIETYDSISYCGLVFDMSPYKIKCLIENETQIEHPANFGKVTLKFENCDHIKSETNGDETSDNTVFPSKDVIDVYKNSGNVSLDLSVLRPDSTESETLDDTESETSDNTESKSKDATGGYKKGFTDGYGYKTHDDTESLTKEIKQLNSKIKSLQDIIDGYNEIYANLVDLNDNKVFELESENSRLKNQCNLMTLYLNKIRRKVGFYLYEDYIMNENDGIRLKEKLENIIERVAPKIDEK